MHLSTRHFPLLLIILTVVSLGQTRPPDPDFATLMERVRERVKKYYVDLQKLSWTETVRQETLNADRTPKDKPREFVYDTIVRLQPPAPGDVSVPFYSRPQNDLRIADGKAVKKGTQPRPFQDPWPEGGGSLLFILSTDFRAPHYTFSYGGRADLEGRSTFLIDVTFMPHKFWFLPFPDVFNPRDIKHGSGDVTEVAWRGDRFAIYGLQQTGKLWVDAESFDVLQSEIRTKPFEFRTQNGRDKLTFELVLTSRFRAITFESPAQTFMVPESSERIDTTKGWRIPVMRYVHSYRDFKRFTGEVQIKPLSLEDLPR